VKELAKTRKPGRPAKSK